MTSAPDTENVSPPRLEATQVAVKMVATIEHDPLVFTAAVRETIRLLDYPECDTFEEHLKKIMDLTLLGVWKSETYCANGKNYLVRVYPVYGYVLVDGQDASILGLDWSGIRIRFDRYDYKMEVLPCA